jgi:NADPH-dependent curcumin reductase CurA
MLYSSFAMIKNTVWPRFLGGGERPYAQVTAFATQKGLEELAQLVGEAKLKVEIDSCVDMENALHAYAVILSKRTRGKVVVKVD